MPKTSRLRFGDPMRSIDLVLRHHRELWSKGDLGLVEELFTPTFVAHHPGSPDTLQTDDGALIYATYSGVFFAPASVAERVQAGDEVDPSEYYFRVAPLFETSAERYEWLNRAMAVGFGRRSRAQVRYSVYMVG